MNYKNLVLQGAGVRIAAHIGALSSLEEHGILQGIENFAGVSAGAIVATFGALGYKVAEIKELMDATDFSEFEDGGFFDKLREAEFFGLHPGTKFLSFIESVIEKKTGNKNSTFSDLKAKGFKSLRVFATLLDTQELIEYSYEKSPNTRVADGVRGSMSIPTFFYAYSINGQIVVDGGEVYNFPVKTFDINGPNPETLGISFKITKATPTHLKYGQPGKFIELNVESILNSQTIILERSPEDLSRSIQIDTLGISAIDFSVQLSGKNMMYQQGRLDSEIFLSKKAGS